MPGDMFWKSCCDIPVAIALTAGNGKKNKGFIVRKFHVQIRYISACSLWLTDLCLHQKLIDISIKRSNIILKDPSQFLIKTNGLNARKSSIGQLLL